MIRQAYLEAAATAIALLEDPAVAASWDAPSALDKLSVRGLAGHLARQITRVSDELDQPVPPGEPIPLIDHYGRSRWVDSDVDSDVNAGIRHRSEQEAAGGAGALSAATRDAHARLRHRLPAEPADRLVHLPGGPWSLTLDDFLTTRLLEFAVHCDDLAVSVGVDTPPLPSEALGPVLDLLCRLAARRHGPNAVLRALSRAERAPAIISAL